MVSTRNHPNSFSTNDPAARPSPSKSSSPSVPDSPPRDVPAQRASSTPNPWSHTPSNLTLTWLLISLPLVIWDTGYVVLRPHSMPGGSLHWPVWAPYGLYGTIDHIYGFPAWDAHNGFTAAQAAMNAVETAGYLVYLFIVYRYGRQERGQGRGAPGSAAGWWGQAREVTGNMAGWAVLVGFAVAVMTLSKTVLYWLNEAFSEFENIGHNDAFTLFFMWIVPNGAWLVFPTYMIYVLGREILQGLEAAAGQQQKKNH